MIKDSDGQPATSTVPKKISPVGLQPLSSNQTPPEPMSMSLRNKNKKRFGSSKPRSIPKKIVFADVADDNNSPSVLPFWNANESEFASTVGLAPRLVPPSEKMRKGLLPSNMFVTSIQLEDDETDHFRGGEGSRVDDLELGTGGEVLDYGERDVSRDEVGFEDIEKAWEGFRRIRDIEELVEGKLVGWKVQ